MTQIGRATHFDGQVDGESEPIFCASNVSREGSLDAKSWERSPVGGRKTFLGAGVVVSTFLVGCSVGALSALWWLRHVQTVPPDQSVAQTVVHDRDARTATVGRSSFAVQPHKAWDVLRRRFRSSKTWTAYNCNSSAYEKQFSQLPQLHLDELALPPRTKTLFYGHSYLMQIMLNIVHAHMEAESDHGVLYVPDIEHLPVCGAVLFSDCAHFEKVYSANVLRWRFSNDVDVVAVFNHGLLQNHSSADTFAKFLDHYGPFDHVFFMKPHPPCFFRYREARFELPPFEANKLRCVELDKISHACFRHAEQFWSVIASRVPIAFEVEPWIPNIRSSPQFFCAQQAQVIYTSAALRPGCAVAGSSSDGTNRSEFNDCAAKVAEHQCLPGRVTLIARDMVGRLFHR